MARVIWEAPAPVSAATTDDPSRPPLVRIVEAADSKFVVETSRSRDVLGAPVWAPIALTDRVAFDLIIKGLVSALAGIVVGCKGCAERDARIFANETTHREARLRYQREHEEETQRLRADWFEAKRQQETAERQKAEAERQLAELRARLSRLTEG